MESNSLEISKQKNSNLSILLIIVNIILLLVFAKIGTLSEDQEIISYILLVIGGTILLGGYAFSYHGKGYRIAKWLFGIALIISIALFVLLWYVAGLAKAFQH
ncbi:hypothetical protein [Pedobacter sp.]|uniref:hypothetical protein n=1 Tax=Pedobacter sp. TaxID=1411316 RepID=UPI003BA85336